MNGVIHAVNDVDEDVSTVIHLELPPKLPPQATFDEGREGGSANWSVGMGFMSFVAAPESRKPFYNADVPDPQSGTIKLADSRLTDCRNAVSLRHTHLMGTVHN
jgi:hypothetical protein